VITRKDFLLITTHPNHNPLLKQNEKIQIHVSTTHWCVRVIVFAKVFSLFSGFSWHSQNCHRYSLSIDCIAPKGRKEPPCQGGSQTRGAAGRSRLPSVRCRSEVWRPSFPQCWPTWIFRPRHLQGLPPWPATSSQSSNRTAWRSYGSEVGWQPCWGPSGGLTEIEVSSLGGPDYVTINGVRRQQDGLSLNLL